MKRIRIAIGLSAAAVAIAAFLTMPAGTAMMKEVQTWFAPEKKAEVRVEGQTEQTDQQLHQSTPAPSDAGSAGEEAQYVIYYDRDRYKLVAGEDKDVITTKEPLPDRYPDVYATIEQLPGVAPADAIAQARERLAAAFAEVRATEQVSEPVAGYRVRAIDGQEWNSEIEVVYATDNGKGGSFVLTLRYFLEAAEGHGARFEQMLQQFQVVQ